MRYDLWKIAVLLCAGLLLGSLAGNSLLGGLLASLMITAWYIYRLALLYRWIRNPSNEPLPSNRGLHYLIHRELSNRSHKNQERNRQLSAHLAQFRRAVSVIPDAIVLIDTSGNIQWANNNARELLGIEWPRDADVRFTNLVRDADCARLLENPEKFSAGIELALPRARDRTLNMSCARYTDELRMIMARDVSHLIEVTRMHRQFVANVSHELKTPLTVLKGYLEIMQNHPQLASELQSPVNQMTAQSERMELIVADLLYLARIEHHHRRSEQHPLEVTQLINGAVESVQSVIAQKRHKLELDIDYEVSLIGNHSELHSAFSNLLNNAIHYTPDGGIIKIRWSQYNGGAQLSVIDNGVGIPGSAIPHLTRRFYRVDDNRSREVGGTGLGLAIVKHVLQRHDAHLEIKSSPGVGSEFRCVFPASHVSLQNTQLQLRDH